MICFTVLLLVLILVNSASHTYEYLGSCIASRSLQSDTAIVFGAICNFLGGLIMLPLGSEVAKTLCRLIQPVGDPRKALSAISAGILAALLFSLVSVKLRLPTAETHSLPAAITGAALAFGSEEIIIEPRVWIPILEGAFLSTLPVFFLGFLVHSILLRFLSHFKRKRMLGLFGISMRRLNAGSGAILYGAQSSQRYLGVYVLGLSLWQNGTGLIKVVIPHSLGIICAAVVALGTLLGGIGIVKRVSRDLAKLDSIAMSAADGASSLIVSICSIIGIPADLSYSKVCGVMGAGMCRHHGTNLRVAKQMISLWLISIPICALLGFVLALPFRG